MKNIEEVLGNSERSLIIIAGPSGVGKTTTEKALLLRYPNDLVASVSATTRQMRDGEEDGVDYYFLSDEEFTQQIEEGNFLEYATVHGHYYGTPIKPIEENIKAGRSVILTIDVQGAEQVKKRIPAAKSIFLYTDKFDDLKSRMKSRGTETDEQISLRLNNAKKELAVMGDFDVAITSTQNEIEKTVDKVADYLKSVGAIG